MRRQAVVVAAMALAAAGCARTPFPVIETQMASLKDQPVKTLLAKFGEPSSNEQINGEKVYVWSTANDNSIAGAAANTISFACTIRVFVDRDENISHYDFKGNVGGCALYAHQLDDTFNLIRWNLS